MSINERLEKQRVKDALAKLKNGNRAFAHPVELNGELVTGDECVGLVRQSILDVTSQDAVVKQLQQLKAAREASGSSQFLVNH